MFWNLGGRMEREAGLHDWLATLKHRKVLFSMNEVGYSRRTARRPNSRLFKESGRCTVPSHSKAHWRRERTLQETSFCPASFAGFLCLSCTRTRGDLPENVSARFSYQLIEEGGGGGNLLAPSLHTSPQRGAAIHWNDDSKLSKFWIQITWNAVHTSQTCRKLSLTIVEIL